ncbi:AraC family transcriptional regulator [Undibacterium pigrum]|uniref:AraC family transcriptional regulator n=1 Tax=Undibacterium pigrum TaxID=401470 RepID=A0A318JCB8_9BURK|nr:AraC family transcriptional regulator [Undibacterium pigrum]PXX45236.1 AraC family transcriptional regulator [Undibacterium pigrum]
MARLKTLADTVPRFWRDDRLPFIEARYLAEGRSDSYDKHAHETFCIGAITAGASNFVMAGKQHHVHAGELVIINPGQVHICSPDDDLPWAFCMLYVDASWLAALQTELGQQKNPEFQAYTSPVSDNVFLYEGLLALYQSLTDTETELLSKQGSVIQYFSEVHKHLQSAPAELHLENARLKLAADFIHEHCTQDLSLDDISAHAGLSASYLFRAFRKQYDMTPHAYLINRRVQYAQEKLRQGASIADAALEAGFADQAHFQRVFKRLLAATPGQYQA